MVCSSDRAWKCQLRFTGVKDLAEGSMIGLSSFGTEKYQISSSNKNQNVDF